MSKCPDDARARFWELFERELKAAQDYYDRKAAERLERALLTARRNKSTGKSDR